ncbi:MAG: glycosyltransferase [Chitinophagaceae bacterium]|nr:glycosyltransferase [Chitinophagaceae bacterium]
MRNFLSLRATIPVPHNEKLLRHSKKISISENPVKVQRPKASMYAFIFLTWVAALIWFEPRLIQLLSIATNPLEYFSLIVFIIFIDFAWLYGIYNIGIVAFAIHYKIARKKGGTMPVPVITSFPPVAILYTTCNDFVEASAISCLQQDYPNYKLYLLDDSTDQAYKKMVDEFAAQDKERIVVVRRPDRKAFKAGNLNYALTNIANNEKYFAIADADEILPSNFLRRLVPVMEADPKCGFVQANHEANPNTATRIQQDMGVGINTHWKWHQPLRNQYGFVMFLGHGALLRYDCWKMIGGFPDIVSEDLGYAIAVREKGYRGRFEEDVTCYEDFPDTVRSFRIRHMKWTRGTCEFLHKKMWWLLKAKNISWVEKADILFPTLNLPLTLVFFLFMINSNLLMPALFGHNREMTWVISGSEWVIPVTELDGGFSIIYSWDFFLITLLTFFSPVLCFIIAMRKTPLKLIRFLSFSTALYAALSILSSIGVIAYLLSGKAIFLVTGDKKQQAEKYIGLRKNFFASIKDKYRQLINKSHPDSYIVQTLEVVLGVIFLIAGLKTMQISFFGLCFAFMLLPVLHYFGWDKRISRVLVHIPFLLILLGVLISGLSIFGMQSVFFGYGFHF